MENLANYVFLFICFGFPPIFVVLMIYQLIVGTPASRERKARDKRLQDRATEERWERTEEPDCEWSYQGNSEGIS